MEEKRTTTSPVDVAQALVGVSFPCTREELLAHARATGATEEALDTLMSLAEQTYHSASEVLHRVHA